MLTKDEKEFLNYAIRNGFTSISKEGNNNYVRIFREEIERDEKGNPLIGSDGCPKQVLREQFCQTSEFKFLKKFKIYNIAEQLESNGCE